MEGVTGMAPQGADRRRWRTSPIPVVALALIGMIVIVGALTFDLVRTARDRDMAVASQSHAHEVMIAANEALAAIEHAETGQRGYLLTADPQFRAPYDYGRRAVPEIMGRLQSLAGDDPSQRIAIAEINDLIRDRFERLQEGVALVDRGNSSGAISLVRSGEGLKTMNAIRERFANLKEVEARNLAARTAEASRAAEAEAQSMYAVIAVGVAMLLVAALLMTAAIRGAIDERVAGIAARGQVRVIQSGKPSASPPPTPAEAPRAETVRATV